MDELSEVEVLAGKGILIRLNDTERSIPQLPISELLKLAVEIFARMKEFAGAGKTYEDVFKEIVPIAAGLVGQAIKWPEEAIMGASPHQLKLVLDKFLILNGYEGGIEGFLAVMRKMFSPSREALEQYMSYLPENTAGQRPT